MMHRVAVVICAAFVGAVVTAAACSGPPPPTPAPSGGLHDYFVEAARFTLEDDPSDLIGEVGQFLEAVDGDLLVLDALRPEVRRFHPDGRLRASYGAVGDGPFEFRHVAGLAEDGEGRVLLVDLRLSRITLLSRDLEPDTLVRVPVPPRGDLLSMGEGWVLATVPAPRTAGFSRVTDQWQPLWSVRPALPEIARSPYWGSFASTRGAGSPRHLAVAYSFLYPIHLYDPNGFLVDSLGPPPPSFRPAPVVERGAFARDDADERMDAWMRSFDEISFLGFLTDTLLVVTHGELRRNRATGHTARVHRRFDVFDVVHRRRIAQDVPLPEGSRVLWVGRERMYLLASEPPMGWTIRRLEWRIP